MEAPLTTATASLSCPRCEHDLRSEHHQAGNTHACFRCGGLFLEGASLKQATLRREVDDLGELSDQIQIAHIDLDPHIPCPCCRRLPLTRTTALLALVGRFISAGSSMLVCHAGM